MAFLDEEQDDLLVTDEPERPRRRVGGPQRRRQQFLVRRLIGVGVGLAFLILIVIGIRGCLEARSDRALRNYASDVASIMQQSEQGGRDFFQLLNSPSGSSQLDVKNQVLAQRDNSQSLLDRAQNTSVPGQMHDPQSAVELTLTLRRNALNSIADNLGQATARAETASALSSIGHAMGSLYASDVLWTQVGSPGITKVLKDENVDAPAMPAGNFMPANATEFLNPTTLVQKLNAITGQTSTAASGTQGLALLHTVIGGTTLSPSSTNTVPMDAREIEIQIQNSGQSDQTGITVVATLGGSELQGTLQALSAGATGTVKIPLTTKPSPGTSTTLQVVVQPVPGEANAENNTSTYTVVFG